MFVLVKTSRAMHHDEVVYPNAKEFIPERFLSTDGSKLVNPPDTKDFGHHSYGFGRKSICFINLTL